MYPCDDDKFEEKTIEKVDLGSSDGWSVKFDDGWSFYVQKDSPVTPKVGSVARLYGKGLGYQVRGLFIDGEMVYYRTEGQDDAFRNAEMYGADCAAWLARWDAGKTVWSIKMGGMGPGYEQAIQITMAEILRYMVQAELDSSKWDNESSWKKDREHIDAAISKHPEVEKLGGITGAMWGAALSLAACFYRRGPIEIMKDEQVKDRHIQVKKTFP